MKTKPKKKTIPFSRLHKWKQRTTIAKDVIKHIEARRLKPRKQVFLDQSTLSPDGRPDASEQLCDVFQKSKKCEACAKGGLFLSVIARINHFTIANLSGRDESQRERASMRSNEMRVLSRYFSEKQLTLIENAFEKEQIFRVWNVSDDEVKEATAFGKKYRTESTRMKAICKNIIKNKGVFKP